MHKETYEFLIEAKKFLDYRPLEILEIGSLDIDASAREMDPRNLFNEGNYTGIDIVKGKGVDIACDAHYIESMRKKFDLIICCEMLEHDSMPWLTAYQIMEALTDRGYVFLSTTNLIREEHYTHYFNFSIEGILSLFKGLNPMLCEENKIHNDIYYVGRK